jgi:hypothetical protein
MKKIIRLTESDLARIVRRVIKEEGEQSNSNDRQKYYDMMKKGKCPDVILTYKKDGDWFDNHTSTSLFDMASSVNGLDLDQKVGNGTLGEYMLLMVRKGKRGIKCGTNADYRLAPEEQQAASDEYGITAKLEKKFAGTGGPR